MLFMKLCLQYCSTVYMYSVFCLKNEHKHTGDFYEVTCRYCLCFVQRAQLYYLLVFKTCRSLKKVCIKICVDLKPFSNDKF